MKSYSGPCLIVLGLALTVVVGIFGSLPAAMAFGGGFVLLGILLIAGQILGMSQVESHLFASVPVLFGFVAAPFAGMCLGGLTGSVLAGFIAGAIVAAASFLVLAITVDRAGRAHKVLGSELRDLAFAIFSGTRLETLAHGLLATWYGPSEQDAAPAVSDDTLPEGIDRVQDTIL